MSVLDRFRLDGRVPVRTGTGSGLGAGFAVALAEARGRSALAVATDVAPPEDCGPWPGGRR